MIRKVVHDAYVLHLYLGTSNKLIASEKKIVERCCDVHEFKTVATSQTKIHTALENLAAFLVKHFNNRVFVLADEYDSICSDSIIYVKDKANMKAEDEVSAINALCMGALSCLLKANKHMDRAVLTGILFVSTMGLSKLTNVEAFKFQENHNFSRFYGLTTDELKRLLEKCKKSSDYSRIMDHYNGYRDNTLSIWSVMKYLNFEL